MTDFSRAFGRRELLGAGLLLAGLSLAAPRPLAGAQSKLVDVADETTGLPLLRLPEGFGYRSFGWTGDRMLGGLPTPARHDGMGCVGQRGDLVTLVRNHEEVFAGKPLGPVPTYDPRAKGGTTTLRFNVKRGEWLDARPSLAGTFANCAGGTTPWGSWLSCEEAVIDADGRLGPRFNNRSANLERPHGYVFDVPGDGVSNARPLPALGRFRHEAVAIDPESNVVYLTEDNQPVSGVYRFVPDQRGSLEAGRLQMLAVPAQPDLRRGVTEGVWFDVGWVDIEDPDAGHNPGTLDSAAVFTQGKRAGGATFRRPEGCWFENGRLYFSDTTGGNARRGQIFVYEPAAERLQLLFESRDKNVLDHPDNIAKTPGGGLLICEDRPRRVQRIKALNRAGELVHFADNNLRLNGEQGLPKGDYRNKEWAGACFSPDGNWLFANIQKPGVTFAITGPWAELGL